LSWTRGGGSFRLRFGRRGWFEQHAAHQIRDVVRDDAQLVLCLEDTAEPFVEERNQLFGREPYFFSKFKYPNFSGSQILPFTRQA
jgi:hypothetical protein